MTDRRAIPGSLVWDLPEPTGRAGQPSLSRSAIVHAALDIADTDGEQAVTMRRVATALGSSTPMSLYRYVGSRDGILDLMLDEVIGEIGLPDQPPGHWRDNLRLLAHRSRAALRRHPWYPATSHQRPMFGPHALRHNEWMLAAFDGCGLSLGTAMRAAGMVFGYAVSYAQHEAEEDRMRQRTGLATDADLREAGRSYVDRITADPRYPRLGRWISQETPPDPDEQFELGLECLLDGIAARMLPGTGPEPSGR